MLMPIVATRNAAGPGDDAVQNIRRSPVPVSKRAEAIQKILDALGRHLSGREILSSDALLRLIEDLSRLLRSPVLPQQPERDVARRLLKVLELLPAPERQMLARELDGHRPAQRIQPPIRALQQTVGAASSQPAAHSASRSLVLQAPMAPQSSAAQTSASGDVALLQAMLEKTCGAGGEAARAAQTLDETAQAEPQAEPDATPPGDAAKASNPGEGRIRPGDTRNQAPTGFPSGPAVPSAAESEAAERILPKADDAPHSPEQTVLRAPAGGDAFTSRVPTQAEAPKPDQILDDAETPSRCDVGSGDELDADGTYGPPRAREENTRQPARPDPMRGETVSPARAIVDAVKLLANTGLIVAAKAGGRPEATEHVGNAVPELPTPEHARDVAMRQRNISAGHEASSDLAAAELPEASTPGGSPSQARTQHSGEDPAMQQALALLVENGLPRGIISLALLPYPPAETEAEDGGDSPGESDGEPKDDGDEEAEAGPEDDKEEQEKRSEADGEPDASDAYALYRKLGDLG